ncbi:KilA domain-containing protein [Sphingobacterium deserti]|uniref:KilA domain-containing protein n=1 Tax=Sphingobacterium deserti TaxID=1229276 RepID=A0A0B8T486_9SPHI|nr:KilA domain-containing protein [Sphingobacterium deserti]
MSIFKVVESDHFKMQSGLPNFVLSVSEWIEKTDAIGIIVKKGNTAEPKPIKILPSNSALPLAYHLNCT